MTKKMRSVHHLIGSWYFLDGPAPFPRRVYVVSKTAGNFFVLRHCCWRVYRRALTWKSRIKQGHSNTTDSPPGQ
jgi:hypothetical protein